MQRPVARIVDSDRTALTRRCSACPLNLAFAAAIMLAVNKAKKLDELVGSVEELLSRLPEELNPQVAALRDKVDDGIFDAWKAISNERLEAARANSRAAPVTLSALVGLTVLLAFSARLLIDRSRRSNGARRR